MPHLASVVGAAAIPKPRVLTGVVVSAGKMQKCVKVRIAKQKWNKKIQKYYSNPYNLLVHDPASSTREGDVVTIQSGWRTGRHVHHVITSIVAPMGPPISQRPPVPTEVERIAAAEAKRAAKDIRQAAKGRDVAVARVKRREMQQREAESRVGAFEEQLSGSEKEIGDISAEIEKLRLKEKSETAEEKTSSTVLEAQREEMAKIESGEKELPRDGTIGAGNHHVGRIQDRAQHYKQQAMRLEGKGLRNEEKLDDVNERQEERPVREEKQEKEKKGWARWFGP